jgi:hypothetical protein
MIGWNLHDVDEQLPIRQLINIRLTVSELMLVDVCSDTVSDTVTRRKLRQFST